MDSASDILAAYLHLARASERRQRLPVRDRLLLLAAVRASLMGLPAVAQCCRARVLDNNPQHLVRRWPTIAAALAHEDFLALLRQIERHYPLERVEHLLATVGVDRARERDAYYTAEEYAAALLNETPASLQAKFGPDESAA